MTDIYKVNHIKNGVVDTIYIFNGGKNKNELENNMNININKPPKVVYSKQKIHSDDTIGMIKIKILNELKKSISLDEIYLYCQKIETFNSVSLYQTLTQNKKLSLTNVRLEQFVSNIVSELSGNESSLKNVKERKEKDVYDYDDIVEMKLDNKKFIVNKVLGQKFFIIENEYPYVVNPYDVKSYDSFLERNSRKSLSTLNSHLLLNSGEIINNTIFLCTAQDVLTHSENNNIPQDLTLKIYYPFLYENNINNLEDLKSKQRDFLTKNDKYLNESTIDYFNTIDMFYNIYELRKNELNYVSKGIKYLKAVIKPIYKINIPLEILFKILHATQENPLIKYNPSSRQENIYRLFTDKIATDGRKIPYLKRGSIFKLIKNIGKTKSVSVYINSDVSDGIQQFICEFDQYGFVTIICELEKVMDESQINILFKNNINPIIEEISNFLEQSGYKIALFEDIKSDNIEIKQLTYESNIKIKQSINLEAYKGCVSSIFNNESSSFKKDIHLRFKRVSNFNKVTSQEAFIMEKSVQGFRGDEIIDALLENFQDDLNRNQAEELVQKVANEIQLERGVKKIDIKIKDNPGFKTTIQLEQKTGVITIRVENINDIYYLNTIPIYLDSIVRITQAKNTTKYPVKKINEFCSSKEKNEIKIFDIISPVESQLSELEIPSIDEENENLEYVKMSDASASYSDDEDRPKNALDLFFDDDDEEEEDEEDDNNSKQGGQLTKKDADENSENMKLENKEEPEEEEEEPEEEEEEEPEEEEEEPEEEEEEPEEEEEEENEVINIDNLPLKKKEPYFQTRIENLDPALIIKEDSKEFNSYVRVCSSTTKRQPVILTDKELDKINKDHPGFLREEDVIKYGSDPKKQYSYICPRYWCLKNNTIVDPKDLTEVIVNGKKELKSPNCGYVLPDDAKTVKPGYYVYEFYKPKNGKQEYKRYPGLQTNKHPQGYCLPCCFEKYNTIGRLDAKKQCKQNQNENEQVEDKINVKENVKENVKQKKGKQEDEYIIGPDRFPLPPGRWGYLQTQIQQILNEVNADCQISKTNTNLKPDHPCLLRHGIEINDRQSFVACISDILFYGSNSNERNTSPIKAMKETIIQALTIDNFITYQNGNLVNEFKNTNLSLQQDIDIEREKYTLSKLYSKINQSNEDELLYFKKVISAFENFINYLKDDDAIIDHTYLWDIISKPNPKLFTKGVNLIIFKIPNDDITNNVELLCPSNHYSNEFYETRKPTVFIIKEDKYYEPIYSYTITNKKYNVIKTFNEYDPRLSISMRNVFKELIKPFLSNFCKPLDSMPNVYKAKRAPLLISLIQKLDKYDYNVLKLVMNFNNKIIGVIAESPTASKLSGFVPCYPSSYSENIKNNLDFVFMNDLSLWKNYEDTFNFLTQLYNKSTKRKTEKTSDIHCKPMLKVIEDELVVGIITETNQFIQISQPIPENDIKSQQNLPSLKNTSYIVNTGTNSKSNGNNYISSDSVITTSDKVDSERVDYIKKITYETNFYNIFRNTIRVLLNDYSNVKIREQIENEIFKDYIIYSQKLAKINTLLRELVNNTIQFIGDENYYKLINEFTTCIVKNKDSCAKLPNLCMFTDTNTCNLILPKKNLMTGKENEEIYFGKVSDELIRYSRIQSFILQPQSFLSFGNIGYNLRDNEIIMLQSLLTPDYFETLEPAIINKYVRFNSYDETEPIITQTYDNVVSDVELEKNKSKLLDICNKQINNTIMSRIWKRCFPEKYKEIEYAKNINCTFEIIIDIIQKKTGEKIQINTLKNVLYEEYMTYLKNYPQQIITILIAEGKKNLGDQVNSNKLSFSSFIYSDNYFLTVLDYWLLVNKYKIPTFFISTKNLLQTNYEKKIFLGYSYYSENNRDNDNKMKDENDNEYFCFILVPELKVESVPSYKLIINEKDEIFVSMKEIKKLCDEEISYAFDNRMNIGDHLKQFVKISKPKKIKGIPLNKKINIQEDYEDAKDIEDKENMEDY